MHHHFINIRVKSTSSPCMRNQTGVSPIMPNIFQCCAEFHSDSTDCPDMIDVRPLFWSNCQSLCLIHYAIACISRKSFYALRELLLVVSWTLHVHENCFQQCIFIPFNVDLNVVLVMISNIQSCSSSATLHVSDRLSGLKSEFCSQKYEVSKANTISRLGNGSRLRLMFELWLFANGEHPMEALRRFSLLFPVSRICHIQRKFMKKNAMFWLHSDRTRRLVFASNFERWS